MTYNDRHAAYLARCTEGVQRAAARLLQKDSIVSKAAAYSLLNGGKRVRGMLTLAVCDLLGGGEALPFAAALEMVHAFSLVHDDLPCMDDDDLRRGKPACHVAFGEANALLAGDALAIAAFEEVAAAPLPAEQRVKAAGVLAAAAGARGMIYGQELDILHEGKPIDEAVLLQVYACKTGALINAAARLGALAAGADETAAAEAFRFADTLGLVFQIVDDVLDVEGEQAALGKPIGSDAANAKTTFATLRGVQGAKAEAHRLTGEAVAALQAAYGEQAAFLAWYAQQLAGRMQ